MTGLHGGDHIVHRAPLEGVHGRGPGMVEMAQLRVAAPEFELLPVLEPEGYPAVCDRFDFGGAAVDQPQPGIVAGPADAVAGAKLDPLGPVDLGAAPAPADFAGLPGDRAAPAVVQQHAAAPVIDARDAALVAFLDADPLVGAVERDDIAHPVVAGERLFRVGVALRDQAFTGLGRTVDAPLAGEPLSDTLGLSTAAPSGRPTSRSCPSKSSFLESRPPRLSSSGAMIASRPMPIACGLCSSG